MGRAGSRSTYYSCQKKSVMIMVDRYWKHVFVLMQREEMNEKRQGSISFEEIVNEHI
jgi:hypothetical protein